GAEDLPKGAWELASQTALLLPLAALGQGPSGVLLAATSPAKALDESYRTFFELLARQIATSIADTRAFAIGMLAGPEHRWIYVNEQYVRVTGRSGASDFVGKTIRESLPEIETQPFIDLLDEVYRTGKPYVGREVAARLNRSHTGQPEEAYFDFVYQPVTNADGSVEGILIHAVEVTDTVVAKKVAEQRERALRESEQRFRVITDATPVLVWMSGTDKLCTYFNRSWLDFVGRTLEQELGNGWTENVHPDDFERCLKIYVSSFDTRQPFEMEYRLRHHSGQYRWILDRGVPRYAPDGTFEGYVGGCLDISEKKDATQKLQTALVGSQRLAAIVESSNDAIVSKDLNGVVTSWNPAAERMFGYTAEEMIGRSIRTVIPLELQDEEDRILATVGSGEKIEHFETVRITKSGERIDVSLTISPVKDETGSIVGVAKIARDVTEQKRTERALRMSERLASVGRLAATVAHEINNPLEAITNLLYLAKERALRDDVREFLAQAEEELARVSHLTKQTLGFYRDTKAPNIVKVGALVTSLLSIFAPRCRNKGVEIFPEIQDDARLFAVPDEIRQIIANLLSNSIDAVQPGGRIRIRVSSARTARGRAGVRITVADSGHGIPPKVRSRLFEPFLTTKKDVGTGLGLWVCMNIVNKHQGTIRVKSCTEPGRSWTAFSVFLPSLQAESVEGALKQAV
ncbi:MAG: PAS domain S-box protein, partial [Vulcanimicrobiaceae bacterium]